MKKIKATAGVILNGGKSSRMGLDKSMLKLTRVTLLEQAKQLLRDSGLQNIYISGKQGIEDSYKDKGPLGGILTCLSHLSHYNFILFIPVDMPLLNKEIISELYSQKKTSLSYFEDHNLPLMIQNDKEIRTVINKQIEAGALSLYQLFDLLNAKALVNNHPKRLFINTNSPQQWKNAMQTYKEINLNSVFSE